MAIREVGPPAGAPWQRPLTGRLDTLVVESEMLAGNPLGDPARRPLYVYSSPGAAQRSSADLASVYVIQGFTGQLDMLLAHDPLEPSVIERVDAMFTAGNCPDGIVTFVDAWTSLGGSQFLNSTSTGRYMDYLCDEIVPFVDARYPTAAHRAHRGIAGKSSGGYGAMVVPMLRPDVFGALASHAGDALFECCYLPEFRTVARTLRDHFEGSYEVFFARLAQRKQFDFQRFGRPLELYAYAAAYSPDPATPGAALIPFDLQTGRLVDHVWEQWLALDPVRMAVGHADALASMRRIYLDAGRSDEAYLDLSAQAFARELEQLGIAHTLELFEGRHGGVSHRYPGAIRELLLALDPSGPAA
ncbi:MAG: alpha/beta hydrolase-fold protein [Solirubrobacteraceae bacterium]